MPDTPPLTHPTPNVPAPDNLTNVHVVSKFFINNAWRCDLLPYRDTASGRIHAMSQESENGCRLLVNGASVAVNPGSTTLLDVLREDLDLTGAKKACDNGECGSCIVLMRGKPTKACLLPARRAAGKDIVTTIREILDRGSREGQFRDGVDAVQLYVSILSLSYLHLSNRYTLSFTYETDLGAREWIARRRVHVTEMVLSYLSAQRTPTPATPADNRSAPPVEIEPEAPLGTEI